MNEADRVPRIVLNPSDTRAPYRDAPPTHATKQTLPDPSTLKSHPRGESKGAENASLFFVGTATTILEWGGVRIMTDPNFLHAGDHVHLGPGVTATRKTNPAVDLHDLPRIDLCLVSHYHADHFDQKVEASLRRDLPIITTPHAKTALTTKSPESDNFTAITALDAWSTCLVSIPTTTSIATEGQGKEPVNTEKVIKVTATPGKHVPPGPAGLLEKANDLLGAVPPTNGWMLELGHPDSTAGVKAGYTIYISGDTLMISELALIPEKFPHVDLMLVHLGGTTIPGPHAPLLMVTMDAKQGIQLVRLIKPDVTIPIHYDDYDVFLSPLEDFKKEMSEAGLDPNVVYLDRGEAYSFTVPVQD